MFEAVHAECMQAGAPEQTLALWSAHLTNMEGLSSRKDTEALRSLVGVAAQLVALIDQAALAAAFGVSIDKDDKTAQKQRKKDEAKKKALVTALQAKALALADLHTLDADAHPIARLDEAMVPNPTLTLTLTLTPTRSLGSTRVMVGPHPSQTAEPRTLTPPSPSPPPPPSPSPHPHPRPRPHPHPHPHPRPRPHPHPHPHPHPTSPSPSPHPHPPPPRSSSQGRPPRVT